MAFLKQGTPTEILGLVNYKEETATSVKCPKCAEEIGKKSGTVIKTNEKKAKLLININKFVCQHCNRDIEVK